MPAKIENSLLLDPSNEIGRRNSDINGNIQQNSNQNATTKITTTTTTTTTPNANFNSCSNSNNSREQLIEKDVESTKLEFSYSTNVARLVSLIVLVLHCMALGPIQSLMTQYLVDHWRYEAGHNKSEAVNQSRCWEGSNLITSFENELSARASTTLTYYNYVSSILATVSSLFLGAYADIIGRRIIILSPALSVLLHFILCTCIMRFNLDINYFYITSTILGLGGSIFAMLIGIFTVTADVNTSKSNRVLWLALNICVSSVTLGLVSIGVGYVIKYIGYYQATAMLTVLAALSFFVALFFLPETLPKRAVNSTTTLNPIANLRRVFTIYTKQGSRRRRICLLICLSLFFFGVIPDLQLGTLDTLYQIHRPLCWDSMQVGYYGALQMGGKKLLGTIVLKVIQVCGWIRDEKLAVVGTLFQAGSMVLEAFVKYSWQMYLVPLLGIPAIITVPVVRGIMSILVGPYDQGALFASIAVVETVCTMISGTSINRMYTSTVAVMPGAVYFLMATFGLINFLLFIPFFHFYEDPTKKIEREETKKIEKTIHDSAKQP